MRVTVVRGGGVAGLTSERSVDSAELDDQGAALLRARVTDALGPTAQSAPPGSGPDPGPGPDEYAYEVSIADDDGTVRTLRATDTQGGDGLRDLVAFVRARGRP